MLPPALAHLLAYHAPLSTLQRDQEGGAVSLLTPRVNVLSLNATYLPCDPSGVDLPAVAQWHAHHDLPPLVATTAPLPDTAPVATLRVGGWAASPLPPSRSVVVEQISRLHLGPWAEALTQARGTPGWGSWLARHLGARLETERSYLPLLAYQGDEIVGALLWQAQGPGGAALLWGARHAEAARALLDTAAGLSASLLVAWGADDLAAGLQPPEHEAVVFSRLQM
ncbi:hypothetical protein [Deinococcus aquaedulcis]|uniref:hypothetical protein n=1 Tax=Deinococcus aquaedulcis TaxID=2840455 RepID=UPI001C82EADB|nr:hypothetical protein [Deinococcus aquaedulcis]